FRNARQSGFLSALLRDPEAPVRLWRLRIGDQLAAFAVVLEGERVWHFYLATYREDHPHTGAYLLNRIIEAACHDDECDFFDLLRGRFDYKEAWMDEVRVLYEVICPNGWRGALLAYGYRIRWALARSERLQRWRSMLLRVGDRRP
ncbi:MAG: GNAT family N-acetyltransferase, partial [Gemmatimonadota bacterium]